MSLKNKYLDFVVRFIVFFLLYSLYKITFPFADTESVTETAHLVITNTEMLPQTHPNIFLMQKKKKKADLLRSKEDILQLVGCCMHGQK